jgi:hypothetical protein
MKRAELSIQNQEANDDDLVQQKAVIEIRIDLDYQILDAYSICNSRDNQGKLLISRLTL